MKDRRIVKAALALAVLLLPVVAAHAAGNSYEQKLTVRLNPDENRLHAFAVLTLQEPASGSGVVSLTENARIQRLLLNGDEAKFSFSDGLIRFDLSAQTSYPAEIAIEYTAAFADEAPAKPVHDEDPSYGIVGSISARGIFLGAGSRWHPAIPGASAKFRVRVEAPRGLYAVTDGKRLGHHSEGGTTVSEWRTKLPRKRLALAAGNFVVGEARAGDTPVYTYFRARNEELQQSYLERSVGYIRMYEALFGPYPFAKFAVVENFFPTGYGFASWTLIGGTVLRLPFIAQTSLGHEIAHCWWGNGVLTDYASGNWSEGLAAYVAEHHYKALESPEEARDYRLKILRDYAMLAAGNKAYPLDEFRSRKTAVDQAVGYGKAAMIFHMLRMRLGEDAFFKGLNLLARTRMGRTTSWKDLQRSFEQISGSDLSVFFDQWLTRRKGPEMALRDVTATRQKNGWLVSGTLVQEPPCYDLEVPLTLTTGRDETTSTLRLAEARKTFRLSTPFRPRSLQIDPQVNLFRVLHPVEVPPVVNAIRGSDSLLIVIAGTLPSPVRSEALGLGAALRQNVTVIEESDLTPGIAKSHDLLFLGWPVDFAPPLPSGTRIDARGFSHDGVRYEAGEDALFAALRHPSAPDRSTAVYLPLSAKAARGANRKIPHYGNDSLLIFKNGRNVVRETWPGKPGPSLHLFGKQ